MGPHLASILQGVNLALFFGGGGLGVAQEPPPNCLTAWRLGTMGPLWELRVRADCWHRQCTMGRGTSPRARLPALLSPPGTASVRGILPALTSKAWPKLLAPAAAGGPSGSAHIDIQTAVTLQEAGACGPGRVGVGADETGCMPVILPQGRQEGQMGFLVSVLAPSGKKGLRDCESSDRQGPLTPGLRSYTHCIDLLPEEAQSCQPRPLGLGHWQCE